MRSSSIHWVVEVSARMQREEAAPDAARDGRDHDRLERRARRLVEGEDGIAGCCQQRAPDRRDTRRLRFRAGTAMASQPSPPCWPETWPESTRRSGRTPCRPRLHPVLPAIQSTLPCQTALRKRSLPVVRVADVPSCAAAGGVDVAVAFGFGRARPRDGPRRGESVDGEHRDACPAPSRRSVQLASLATAYSTYCASAFRRLSPEGSRLHERVAVDRQRTADEIGSPDDRRLTRDWKTRGAADRSRWISTRTVGGDPSETFESSTPYCRAPGSRLIDPRDVHGSAGLVCDIMTSTRLVHERLTGLQHREDERPENGSYSTCGYRRAKPAVLPTIALMFIRSPCPRSAR